jgi:hypothetical protein
MVTNAPTPLPTPAATLAPTPAPTPAPPTPIPMEPITLPPAGNETILDATATTTTIASNSPAQSNDSRTAAVDATVAVSGTPSDTPPSANLGLIIGCVVGGVCLLALLMLAVLWFSKKRAKRTTTDSGLERETRSVPLTPIYGSSPRTLEAIVGNYQQSDDILFQQSTREPMVNNYVQQPHTNGYGSAPTMTMSESDMGFEQSTREPMVNNYVSSGTNTPVPVQHQQYMGASTGTQASGDYVELVATPRE